MPNFPKWMRIASLIIGLLLLGDGMRRFISPSDVRDLSGFISYVIVGVCCMVVALYSPRPKR